MRTRPVRRAGTLPLKLGGRRSFKQSTSLRGSGTTVGEQLEELDRTLCRTPLFVVKEDISPTGGAECVVEKGRNRFVWFNP